MGLTACTKIIACQTVGEELKSLIPDNIEISLLRFGLHNTPKKLHDQLQDEIDAAGSTVRTILLGYGLCANAIAGLKSRRFRLVIPRVDDCIALFLGSRDEYLRQFHQTPGTYYLTKGWIESGEDPYTVYCSMREKYGHDKAYRVSRQYIANYTRLALIKTGNYNSQAYEKYAGMVADYFGLTFQIISGSNSLLKKLVSGDWDDDFIIVEPGDVVRFDMFYTAWGIK